MQDSIPTLAELRRHRQRVAETIRRTARWRRAKANEHPEFHKDNARGATALRRLANFVESMAVDDLDLRAMRASRLTSDGEAYRLSREASDKLAGFGLGRGSWQGPTPDEAQLRNILRRVEGQEAKNRHLMRQRADAGYGEG